MTLLPFYPLGLVTMGGIFWRLTASIQHLLLSFFSTLCQFFSCLILLSSGVWYDFFCCWVLISICYLISSHYLAGAWATLFRLSDPLGLSNTDSFLFTTKRLSALCELITNNQLMFDKELQYIVLRHLKQFIFISLGTPLHQLHWKQVHSAWFFPFI